MSTDNVGPNELCPCGSGKNFKVCCLHQRDSVRSTQTTPSESPNDPVLEFFSTNMLRNRVEREARTISDHFDVLVQAHIVDIDLIYSSACKNLILGKRGSESDHDSVRTELAILLTNHLKSFTAAFALLRTGWRLQPFLCIRNCYESLSVVLHLFHNWEDLAKFKLGKLDSTSTFNSAKRLIPQFGRIYGQLSEEFAHIGRPFGYIQAGHLYAEDDKTLWLCLVQLAYLIWFTFETTELVFYDYLETRIFWNKKGMQARQGRDQVGQAYELGPTTEAETLRKRIFSAYSGPWNRYFLEVQS